ncbi:MAG: AgmX/PglI C-terminal domain-containing protein [Pseudomonadota bacterium]
MHNTIYGGGFLSRFSVNPAYYSALFFLFLSVSSCGNQGNEGSGQISANCKQELEKLQTELNTLKQTLAQALANPGTVKVDPSLLLIEGGPDDPVAVLREGTLKEDDAIKTVTRNMDALESCYQRLMKRDTSFHHRTLKLIIGFSVQPSGAPKNISVDPNYDAKLTDCITKAIKRWNFPRFAGQPVGVEAPVTLRPKA